MTRTWDDVMTDAVTVLTEAAHLHQPVRPDAGRRYPERIDFAEFLYHALLHTAANLGGVDELLAGRPGSWEASAVRELLGSWPLA